MGEYILRIFGDFDFDGIEPVAPTRTFDGELTMQVGDKEVRLIEVGPAHTRGDILVCLPQDRVIFTGDILFINGHPIVWAGPVDNWIKACDRIIDMDVDVIVPGHGPITDKQGVAQVKGYLTYISAEARQHYDAGLSAMEAAKAIALDTYASWTDAERIVVNVHTLYREFSNDSSPVDFMGLFGQMAMLASA